MRVLLAALLVPALVAGCADKDKTYGRSDVERAFNAEGFALTGPADLSKGNPVAPASHPGAVYLPGSTDRFVILVYDHKDDADADFQTLRSRASYKSFDVQKGNVVVFSDEGVTPSTRIRINAALFQLS